ncbi:MAG: 3-hydroxyacyl-CoA dehydrogenase family protein [Solibacillus sp.]
MLSTGAPVGPFGILDIVGMETPYNLHIMQGKKPTAQFLTDKIKYDMVDQGKMGISTGKGFYSYPNPAYKDTGFLKNS